MNKRSPEIKFCGLTKNEDVAAAIDLSIDFIGLVFFPKSPRHVSMTQARSLAEQAKGKSRIVALTVNADDTLIDRLMQKVEPDFFQLHGSETTERILQVKKRTGKPVIKAIGVSSRQDIEQALKLPLEEEDLFLFDAKPAPGTQNGLPGGNGLAFDWHFLQSSPLPSKYMLAGGLTPQNIETALRQTKAPIIDVSSGIETSPGRKSLELMSLFAENARKVFAT